MISQMDAVVVSWDICIRSFLLSSSFRPIFRLISL